MESDDESAIRKYHSKSRTRNPSQRNISEGREHRRRPQRENGIVQDNQTENWLRYGGNVSTFTGSLDYREKSLKMGDGLKRSQILLIFFLWIGAILSALQTSTDLTASPVNGTEM